MVDSALYAGAIKSLWVDRCTVKTMQDEENANSRTVQTKNVLFENEACRLSHKSVTVTDESSHAARTVQGTVLFLDSDMEIPPGSTIIVTHEGVTREYRQSGAPARYSVHQEIPLELRKEWA